MAIPVSDNYKLNAPKKPDDWSGVFDGSPPKWRPYNNVQEYIDRKPVEFRVASDMFFVKNPTDATRMDIWVLDVNLVPFLLNIPVMDGKSFLGGIEDPEDSLGEDGDHYVNTVTGLTFVKDDGEWEADGGNLKGTDGTDGFSVLSGNGVPSNSLGVNGDTYLNSDNGDIYSKSGGSWGSPTGNIRGAQGLSVLSGAGVPDNSLGSNGQTYLDTTSGDTYIKSGGTWSVNGNIKGAKGDKAVINSTSTTSNVIEIGTKTFDLDTPLDLVEGQIAKAYSLADPTNYVCGFITDISPTSITINVSEIGGSGTKEDWVIGLGSFRGEIGISTTNMTVANRILGLSPSESVPQPPKQIEPQGFTLAGSKIYNAIESGITGTKVATINNPSGGLYSAGIASSTGAIKIKLPTVGAFTSFVTIEGVINNNVANGGTTLFCITCYPSSMAFNFDAILLNNSNKYDVRGYTDGDDRYVTIGTVSSVWAYLSVSIKSVKVSHVSAEIPLFSSGWQISLITAFTGTLTVQRLENLPNPSLVNPITGYNAASGTDTDLTATMTPLQAWQNLQAQIKTYIKKAGTGLNIVLDNGTTVLRSTFAAFTATKLATPRQINGVDFDGSGPITIYDATKIPTTEKGAANGVAPLNSSMVIDQQYLPSYVDDVIDGYKDGANFYKENSHTTLIVGEIGKIYIDLTTGEQNKQYRWSGSVYIQITNGLIASTNDVPEGSNNLYFTVARVLATVLTGFTAGAGTVAATDSILQAINKIVGNIALKANIDSPTFTGTPVIPSNTQPLGILSQSGATTDQSVKWNGSAWIPYTPSGGGTTILFGSTTMDSIDASITKYKDVTVTGANLLDIVTVTDNIRSYSGVIYWISGKVISINTVRIYVSYYYFDPGSSDVTFTGSSATPTVLYPLGIDFSVIKKP